MSPVSECSSLGISVSEQTLGANARLGDRSREDLLKISSCKAGIKRCVGARAAITVDRAHDVHNHAQVQSSIGSLSDLNSNRTVIMIHEE